MKKLLEFIKGRKIMMINYFAMQIELGWITLEQVPAKYRDKVKELIDLSNVGTKEG